MVVLLFGAHAEAQQQDISIYTSQDTYYYGEFLTFTIMVPKVTGEHATLYIIDELGKSSAPIPMIIDKKNTTITSPFPFESQTYPLGQYTITIQYADQEALTEFTLDDDGRTVIPIWIKDVGKLWIDGAADKTFASAIEFLINDEIIKVSKDIGTADKVIIPDWVKIITEWWIQGLVSDDDFAKALQFLINTGAVKV